MAKRTNPETETGYQREQPCDETSSTDEIRRCTASTRQNMDQTMRAIEEKLSPGRILDDFITDFRERVQNRSFDLSRTISRDPAPFAMVGIGMLLLGAGLAGYSFSKMNRNAYRRRRAYEPEYDIDYQMESSPEEFEYPENEPIFTPSTKAESFEATEQEEASTENIQKEYLKDEEQEEQL